MRITHEFKPFLSSDLIQVIVRISNVGNKAFEEVQYCRSMDWDIDPTKYNEANSHLGIRTTVSLVFSHTNPDCHPLLNATCMEDSANTTNIPLNTIMDPMI
jgi:hypothetical protein